MDEFKWINRKDRLPDKPGMYLVTGKWRGSEREYWICEFAQIGMISGWCNPANTPTVEYWMPFPELKEAE